MASETFNLSGIVRPAQEADLNSILKIEQASFEQQWGCDQFKAALNDIFLLLEEKEIVGFVIACYCQLVNKGIIVRIAVNPSHRGKGIAKILLGEALDRLKALGVREIELSVDIVKTGAIKLYEKFGFKVLQVVSMNFNDNDVDESFYMMKLSLE
ncbi:MAG: GNAT family N-acetyltransferase [Thermodesulfobacteriota bacterium]